MKSNLLFGLVVSLASSASFASVLYPPFQPVIRCSHEISLSKIDMECAELGAKTLEFQNFANQEVDNPQLLRVESCFGGRENNYQTVIEYTYAANFTSKYDGTSIHATAVVSENKFPSLTCQNGQYFR